MKLLKNKKINSKHIFELQLLKSKSYTPYLNNSNFKSPKLILSKTITDFKKSLNIIFKYHKHNKRILFIGSSKIIEDLINLNTIHTSILSDLYLENETIINNYLYKNIKLNKYLFDNKKFLLNKIIKKPELIVLFDHNKKHYIIKEANIVKIPVIEINSLQQRNELNHNYNVLSSNPTNRNINNIFFTILNSLFSNNKYL